MTATGVTSRTLPRPRAEPVAAAGRHVMVSRITGRVTVTSELLEVESESAGRPLSACCTGTAAPAGRGARPAAARAPGPAWEPSA